MPTLPAARAVVCPYCGTVTSGTDRCTRCAGRFDPLSRQATQNAMGPWFIYDPDQPTRPGCSYTVLKGMIRRGGVGLEAVLRGPSTRQFWTLARHTPGVAHLLGTCHNCAKKARPEDFNCIACGAPFTADQDRQHLGLGPVRPLPGQEPLPLGEAEHQDTPPPPAPGAAMLKQATATAVPPSPATKLHAGRAAPTPASSINHQRAPIPVDFAEHRAARRAKDRARRHAMVWSGVGLVGGVALVFGFAKGLGLIGAGPASIDESAAESSAAPIDIVQNETPSVSDGPAADRIISEAQASNQSKHEPSATNSEPPSEHDELIARARSALGADTPGEITAMLEELDALETKLGTFPDELAALRRSLGERRDLLRLRVLP